MYPQQHINISIISIAKIIIIYLNSSNFSSIHQIDLKLDYILRFYEQVGKNGHNKNVGRGCSSREAGQTSTNADWKLIPVHLCENLRQEIVAISRLSASYLANHC